MTDAERLEIIEKQIDLFLTWKDADGVERPVNAPILESMLRCRQILKEGYTSFRGIMTEPPESWQK